MIPIALVVCIVLSVGSLAYDFWSAGYDSLSRWLLIFGAAWLFSQWRRWGWFSSVALTLAVFVAAFGMWMGLPMPWKFAGCIFALLAWDLTDFRQRTRFAPRDNELAGMERRHLTRLTMLALAGLALSSIAMFARLKFSFEWTILLVFVAVLGLTQLVAWMKRS